MATRKNAVWEKPQKMCIRDSDQEGAGAAAGIDQRLPGMPAAGQHQTGGEGFADGRFAVPGAVAALGKRRAAGIQADGHMVVADVYVYGHGRGGFRCV